MESIQPTSEMLYRIRDCDTQEERSAFRMRPGWGDDATQLYLLQDSMTDTSLFHIDQFTYGDLLKHFAGTHAGPTILKIPARSIVGRMMLALPYRADYSIAEFCKEVLYAIERAGILLPQQSDIRPVDIFRKEGGGDWQIRERKALAFVQRFDSVILDEENHRKGWLPILGNRALKEFASDPKASDATDIFFDWDWSLCEYAETFVADQRNAMRTREKLHEFCRRIEAASRIEHHSSD
jgi:hypothetical protein